MAAFWTPIRTWLQSLKNNMDVTMVSLRTIGASLILLALVGCSSLETKSLSPEQREKVISETTWGQPTPRIGLALAGGGAKASSFSMGVLQGVVESGLIEHIDILSTVSGGSYAGLWFNDRYILDDPDFSHPGKTPLSTQRSWFRDCYPSRYWSKLDLTRFGVDSTAAGKEALAQKKIELRRLGLNPCPLQNFTNYIEGEEYDGATGVADRSEWDPYRFQNYVRGYQDLFNIGSDFFGRPAFDYSATSEDYRLWSFGAPIVLESVGAMVLTVVPNYLFDWEINLSPTRRVYRDGIARTYGASPIPCYEAGCVRTEELKGVRLEGDVERAKRVRFDEVKRASQVKGAPLWVVNATAGEDRSVWDLRHPSPYDLTAFEFTAFGAGSGLYGYELKAEDVLPSPLEASVASAAFFDTQQKWVSAPPIRNFLAIGMKLTTAEWGVSVKNPQVSDFAYRAHSALPFPLYYLHHFQATKDSAYIHLSDGGQSENLGAYALVRRHVRTMILSDHSNDEKGTMGDICHFKAGLPDDLTMVLPGLELLDLQCEKIADATDGYNVYQWTNPVLVGCIVPKTFANRRAVARQVAADAHVDINAEGAWKQFSPCGDLDDPKTYLARVFVIKPALANKSLLKSLERFTKACFPQKARLNAAPEKYADAVCSEVLINECTAKSLPDDYDDKVKKSPMWEGAPPPSCEVYSFLKLNGGSGPGLNSEGCPVFPQYSTVGMTVNSSPWMYGAMRDLASYYAKRISWFFDGKGALDSERFERELQFQASSPIPRQSLKDLHAKSVGQDNLARCLGAEPLIESL
ncbi:patatin-like phospholipase family protein [Pseudomonas aeruginosa]|nr:patatin-like phospholipase family protein [Pseudomonas aeruginosa]